MLKYMTECLIPHSLRNISYNDYNYHLAILNNIFPKNVFLIWSCYRRITRLVFVTIDFYTNLLQ